uniref:ER membrane protein complex subunit 10 n=1 Tax=Heterorhabditis bacteriophora TaxID=37862 RepID=A0A1I7XVE2_HETBA
MKCLISQEKFVDSLGLTTADEQCWIDLEPFLHPHPHRVPLNASLPFIFNLFRGLGLRYLAVVNDENKMINFSIITTILAVLQVSCTDWSLELYYSLDAYIICDILVKKIFKTADFASVYPLGRIELRRSYEGNYTGSFRPVLGSNLGRKLSEGSDNIYRIQAKSSTQPDIELISYSKPVCCFFQFSSLVLTSLLTFLQCLLLQSKLFHLFWISIDADRQLVHSVTVFPDWVSANNTPDITYNCVNHAPVSGEPNAVVHVSTKAILPSPDTQAFVLKMEKERKARQHGAEQDNRSFLTKYWMYIVPVVLFMVVSNALSPEQSSNGEQ